MKIFKPNSANLTGLDYRSESEKFRKFNFKIIDSHSHINGRLAAEIYKNAAELYGIGLTYSMTKFKEIDAVKEVLGDKIRFIAMPSFAEEEQYYEDISGYMKFIESFYQKGSRMLKFWSAPRGIDIGAGINKPDLLRFDSKRRAEIMKQASHMKMVFMVHVADPDTWFKAKYSDALKYGTKLDQYKAFEKALDTYEVPFIAAHMGGWPEDLGFLDKLLTRHQNLYLDSSATKWIVRELSRHTRDELIHFLTTWKDRVLFGSDIVVYESHLSEMDEQSCFDLYASRYYALRMLFETEYHGKSPIADPDLAMTEPDKYTDSDSPYLSGKNLPYEILENLYFTASDKLLGPYHV